MSAERVTKEFTLRYLKTIGLTSNTRTGRGFVNPFSLAFDKEGNIFVLSRGTLALTFNVSRVGVCNLDEDYLYEFGSGQFSSPTSIAIDSQDRVYVADEDHHRISVFDKSGEPLTKWGDFGSGDGQLDGPCGLALDDDDMLFVVDQNNNRVQKFAPDGRYLSGWGEPGDGDGQFNLPWGITIDSQGDVYVADWRNDRVQKFSSDGRFLAKFGESGDGDGQFNRPSGVAVDSEGYIYVADWGNERVQVLGPDGSFQLMLRGQATLSKWAQEFLAVNPDERIPRDQSNLIPDLPPHLGTPYLSSSRIEPYFWGPVSVDLDKDERLYVTECSRDRLQIYESG